MLNAHLKLELPVKEDKKPEQTARDRKQVSEWLESSALWEAYTHVV